MSTVVQMISESLQVNNALLLRIASTYQMCLSKLPALQLLLHGHYIAHSWLS